MCSTHPQKDNAACRKKWQGSLFVITDHLLNFLLWLLSAAKENASPKHSQGMLWGCSRDAVVMFLKVSPEHLQVEAPPDHPLTLVMMRDVTNRGQEECC